MNSKHLSAGTRLRATLESEHPLQVVGIINAYSAFMAERVGLRVTQRE